MRKIFLFILLVISGYAKAQINPNNGTVSNKSYSPAQAVPTDFRSQFYDGVNFVMRDYNGTSEVLNYLNLSKYRSGGFPIYVHVGGSLSGGIWTGGTRQVWWFKDGTADGNLVRWYTDSIPVPASVVYVKRLTDSTFYAARSDSTRDTVLIRGTAAGGINSLSLSVPSSTFNNPVTFSNGGGGAWSGSMTLLNQNPNSFFAGPSSGGSAQPVWRQMVVADLPTGIPNGNLQNSSINFSIGSLGSSPNWTNPSTSLGGTATLNLPTVNNSNTGIVTPSLYNFWNGKVDSTIISNDSVYEYRNGTRYFRYVVVGGGGGISSLNGLTASTQTFGIGTSGLSPAFNSSGSVHTLNVPLAATTSVTAGLLSNADYSNFRNKLDPALTSAHIFVGNGSNVATDVAMSGDGTLSNTGALTIVNNAITTAKINNNAVTYAKFQAASGAALLGATAAGNYQEITLGTGLSFSGSTLNAAAGGSTNSNIGSGFRWAVPSTNNIKTVFAGSLLQWDSTSNTNALTLKLANGTANYLIGYDGSGNPVAIKPDTLKVQQLGTGDSVGYLATDTLKLRLIRDSLAFHHVTNPDGSLTFYVATGGGITSLNGLSIATQTFATGTTGTDFGISSSGSTHTFNLPTADPTHTGKLSSTDWSTFNNKLNSALSDGHIYMGRSGSAIDTTLYLDMPNYVPIPLSETKVYYYANGSAASSSATNYSYTSIDSVLYRFSTTRAGISPSTEFGGWLANSTSGDSVQVTAPFGVVIGDSQAEGHPGRHGRLHPLVAGVAQNIYIYNYPDSVGQLSYHLAQRTNMRWYNQGIGGQTSTQIRQRFLRDAFGEISNANDSRGTQTLSRPPSVVVIIAGVNDFNAGISATTTENNLEWMASQCQQRGVRCVVLNLPGDAIISQGMLKHIALVNGWLRKGALNQYGASVVDYNSWWNDPTYGYDNIHHTALIVDDIHPSMVGYDSLSAVIVRQSNLPILSKAVFINELDPAGFSGYSRPANITLFGQPYIITKSTDTLNITTLIPDSVWVKVISSTNITGTSTSGFSSILWYLENNANNNIYYTKRSQYNGSTKTDQNIASLTINAPDFNVGRLLFGMNFSDGTPMYTIRGGTASSMAYIGTDSVTGSLIITGAGNPIKTNATSLGNIFGNFQIGNTSAATTTGYGMGLVSGAVRFDGTGGYSNNDGFLFSQWGGGSPVSQSNGNSNAIRFAYNYNSFSGNKDTVSQLRLNPAYNNTSASTSGNMLVGISLSPVLTSQGGAGLVGYTNTIGNNYFNTQFGRTVIGAYGSSNWSDALEVNSTKRGFLTARMTTAQRDSMGHISSVVISGGSWTIAPNLTLSTPGIGSGAVVNCYISSGTTISSDVLEGGVNYVPGTPVTGTLTGGTGSGSTVTVNVSGPTNGTLIYNTTIDSLQVKMPSGWVNLGSVSSNIYNTDGTLTANRTLSGSNFSLALGTSGSPLSSLTQRANNITIWPITGVSGKLSMFGNVVYGNSGTTSDANFTPVDTRDIVLGGALTANRTVTFPFAPTNSGSEYTLYDQLNNAATFKWVPSSALYLSPSDSITSLAAGAVYSVVSSDGIRYSVKSVSPGIGLITETSSSITLSTATDYVGNGTTETFTLPSLNANQGRVYRIKNAGSGLITVNVSGSDHIYDAASVTSITIAAGASRIISGGPSFWYAY